MVRLEAQASKPDQHPLVSDEIKWDVDSVEGLYSCEIKNKVLPTSICNVCGLPEVLYGMIGGKG